MDNLYFCNPSSQFKPSQVIETGISQSCLALEVEVHFLMVQLVCSLSKFCKSCSYHHLILHDMVIVSLTIEESKLFRVNSNYQLLMIITLKLIQQEKIAV